MKRSEVINQISDNVLTSFFPSLSLPHKNLLADAMLTEAEKFGLKLVDLDGEEEPWEPEEGWDAYFIEQDKKDQARDFEVKEVKTRGDSISLDFLNGKSFEELAKEHNVTRERIRQIVCKSRRKYEKT